MYVVWDDNDSFGGDIGTHHILFRASNDGGNTFGATIELAIEHVLISSDPQLQVSPITGDVFAVWISRSEQGFEEISYRSSSDGGLTFNSTVNLSESPNNHSFNPVLLVSGSHLYLIWDEEGDGDRNVSFRTSNDSGISFEPITILDSDPICDLDRIFSRPDIAASGSNVYAIWDFCGEVRFMASDDNGESFGSKLTLAGANAFPQVDSSDKSVYAIWQGPGLISRSSEVFLRISSDNGNTFDTAQILSDTGNQAVAPVIDVADGNIFISWVDAFSDIFLTLSNDSGETFDPTMNISDDNGVSLRPVLAASDKMVFIAWLNSTYANDDYTSDVFFRSGSLQPIDAIEGLLEQINSLDISKGLKASLSAPLNKALALLNDDNPDNDDAVCSKLDKFIHQVNIKEGKGLTSEQAQALLDAANGIKEALAC